MNNSELNGLKGFLGGYNNPEPEDTDEKFTIFQKAAFVILTSLVLLLIFN